MDPHTDKGPKLENLRLEPQRSTDALGSRKLPRHRQGERFLKGPIPFRWLAIAANLPGKALNVGLAIWHWAETRKTNTIRLSVSKLKKDFGTKYDAAYRGLHQLEEAGLISVVSRRGRKPIVTVLDPRDVETQASS